jgi:ABC-type transport system involved in multi-copper enzyme maturation permease subunit
MLGILAEFDMSIAPHIQNLSDAFNVWTGVWWGFGACLIWILCLIPYSKGVILGSLTNTVYLAIGVSIYLWIASSSYGTKMMFLIQNNPDGGYVLNTSVYVPENWIQKYNYTIVSDHHPPDVFYLTNSEAIERVKQGTGYQTNEKILRFFMGRVYSQDSAYAMHIKNSGYYLCPPKIFNPKSCVAIPLVCSIPFYLFWAGFKSALN